MQTTPLTIMIKAQESGSKTNLDALDKLSGILMDDKVREDLLHATSPESVLQIIDKADDEATEEEEAEEVNNTDAESAADTNEPYILAVTACPTGIAHTYMAR